MTATMCTTADELAAIELPRESWDDCLVSPAFLADRHRKLALFEALRREDPVHWAQPEGFRPFWVLTRHADVVAAAKDPRLSAERARWLHASIEEEERALAATGRRKLTRSLVEMDDPDHRKYRAVAHRFFQPPHLRTLQAEVDRLAAANVGRMDAFAGACDFVGDVSMWFPIEVIMLILGLPIERAEWVARMTDQAVYPDDPDMQRGDGDSAVGATGEIFAFYAQLAQERRGHPAEDVASIIANATIDGEPIGEFEAMSYYWALTVAGNDTTAANLAGALALLLENPESLERLRADPDALMAGTIEEVLRYTSIANGFFRAATEDLEIGGQRIRAGDDVLLGYAAANFDAAAFADPYRFDVERRPNRHLSFGQGMHFCLGSHLSKLEIASFLRELLRRTERIDGAGPLAFAEARIGNPIKSLPIRYALRA